MATKPGCKLTGGGSARNCLKVAIDALLMFREISQKFTKIKPLENLPPPKINY